MTIENEDTLRSDIDEVQQDETIEETTEQSSEAELASATGENQTGKNEGSNELTENEKVQKAINRQHFKYREEERKRVKAEQENQQLRERLQKLESQNSEVVIPPLPDPYDEDYQAKITQREDAIRRKAEQDAQKQSVIEQQERQQEAAEQGELERIQAKAKEYDKRITTLGLTPDEIAVAGKTVMEYGIPGDVAEFILDHEQGPLITKYLADNPIVLDELVHLPATQAAVRISSDIAKAAASLKQNNASNAPPPPDTLTGRGGVGEGASPFLTGAKFE